MRLLPFYIVYCLAFCGWFGLSGCAKEYSYERQPVSLSPAPDSAVPAARLFRLGPCTSCNSNYGNTTPNSWSLQLEGSAVCGPFTRTVINPERNFFTFFGPTACTPDSGVIVEAAWSPLVFDRDLYQVSTQRAQFYYYDTISNAYVLLSRTSRLPFSLVIERYNRQTGEAKGYCSGFLFSGKGDTVEIKDFRFSILIP